MAMKRPRKINTYCPKCKKHTVHDVEKVKKRPPGELKRGQRQFRRVTAGYGGFPRPKPEGREKPTRRVWLRYKCVTCKKYVQPSAIRSKKFEFVEE